MKEEGRDDMQLPLHGQHSKLLVYLEDQELGLLVGETFF